MDKLVINALTWGITKWQRFTSKSDTRNQRTVITQLLECFFHASKIHINLHHHHHHKDTTGEVETAQLSG